MSDTEQSVTFEPTSDDHVKTQLVRNNRIVTGAAALMLAYSALTTSGLLYMYNNRQVEVVFVNFDPETSQIVHLKQGNFSTTTEAVLLEKYLRAYVVNREKIDHATYEGRNNFVRVFTDDAWFKAWDQFMDIRNEKSPRRTYRQAGMTREVEITAFVKFPLQENTYQIEFVSIDRKGRDEVKRETWIATIVAARRDLKGPQSDISLNPLGLTITSYQLDMRGALKNENL